MKYRVFTSIKLCIICFCALLMFNFVEQDLVWLDKDLKETNQSEALYYSVGSLKTGYNNIYFKSRNIFRKLTLKNGKIEGKFVEFYETGELKEIGRYENGMREGTWKVYYKTGKIKEKGDYSRGEKIGVWKTFYKNN